MVEIRTRRPHGPDAEPVPDEGEKRSGGDDGRVPLHNRKKKRLQPKLRPARQQGTRIFFTVVQNEG